MLTFCIEIGFSTCRTKSVWSAYLCLCKEKQISDRSESAVNYRISQNPLKYWKYKVKLMYFAIEFSLLSPDKIKCTFSIHEQLRHSDVLYMYDVCLGFDSMFIKPILIIYRQDFSSLGLEVEVWLFWKLVIIYEKPLLLRCSSQIWYLILLWFLT